MGVSSRGLFGFLARLRLPPQAESDADMLDRFVRTADQAAFAGLVRRHGPMVLSVCRRRLGRDSDAEDAFQAVFLALATSAASISRRESLAGWLYRVAYLVALKAAGRRARQPVTAGQTSEVPMPDPLPTAFEVSELRAALDAELAELSDKFRSVVVLCLVEGRTNTEAATVLGIPVGTVDSRLSTARRKLQGRLTRRGLATVAGVAWEQMLAGQLVAADRAALQELISTTVRAVLTEAAATGAGAVSPAVADLARGVTTMTTTKLRLAAALGITLGVLGGAGAGVYLVTAANPARPVAGAADQPLTADRNKPREREAAPDPNVDPNAAPPAARAGDDSVTERALLKPFGAEVPPEGLQLDKILTAIEKESDLVMRVDVAAFRRVGAFGADGQATTSAELLQTIYETKVVLPRRADKLTVRDVLGDALAQVDLNHPCTFQVRGSQILIVPAYVPPVRPGANPLEPSDDDPPLLEARLLNEQVYGGVVSVSADRKPLADILADLRKQSGANIVLDPRCDTQDRKVTLTLSLSDVRLYDALRVIADMADLKMVYAGNIYYVTTPANAKLFQPVAPRPAQAGPR